MHSYYARTVNGNREDCDMFSQKSRTFRRIFRGTASCVKLMTSILALIHFEILGCNCVLQFLFPLLSAMHFKFFSYVLDDTGGFRYCFPLCLCAITSEAVHKTFTKLMHSFKAGSGDLNKTPADPSGSERCVAIRGISTKHDGR